MSIFELFGTIAINNKDANKSISETMQKAKGLATTFGKVGNEALKVGKTIAKGMAVVGAAGTAALGALLKNSIGEYAEYEQLVGGIDVLFKDSQDKVMKYAKSAYKELGLSANDYMSTVTGFSAKLISDLGGDTAAAAEIANIAVSDMTDNANKMGTDITLIQNAYQGFAKQNYTMLDNLKLGYGGTASEMARLINDSGVMGDTFVATAENVNSISFAKLIEAIHVVQSEMELTGSTAEEVKNTIQGSFNAWKASGSNLLTSIASGDEQSIQEATAAFTERTKILLENLKPAVSSVISSIGTLLSELLPGIGQEALNFGSEIIAQIVNGITGSSITSDDVKAAIEKIIDVGEVSLSNTLSFIKDALQWISDNQTFVVTAITAIATAFLAFKLFTDPIGTSISLITAGLALLVTNWEAVKNAIAGAISKLRSFLGLSETAGKAQEEYLAHAEANAAPTALQKYAGRYAHWNWDQRSAAEDLAYAMAQGYSTADEVAALKELGLDQSAIDMLQQDVSEALASGDFTVDNLYVMFEPAAEANLQSQLNSMNLTVPVSTSTEGEQPEGSHASGLNFVPWDNYRANLHMGEMVLPRHEADEYRRGSGGTDTSRLESLMQQVLGIMQQVAANTASGPSIVLDTGAMVGQLAPRLDAHLGTLTARKERRG